MVVRKVQLEYCCKSKWFAPSDDILTVQSYKLLLERPKKKLKKVSKTDFFSFTK